VVYRKIISSKKRGVEIREAMRKTILYLTLFVNMTLFQGCLFFNDRGISSSYYSSCEHYYDSQGFYKEKCDENIVNYKDLNPLKSNGKGVYSVQF